MSDERRNAYNCEKKPDDPHPGCIDRQTKVVNGPNDSSHLGVWGVVCLIGEDLLRVAIFENDIVHWVIAGFQIVYRRLL